jgi:hypothetical protein
LDKDLTMRTQAHALTTLSLTTLLAVAGSACVGGEVGGGDAGRSRKPKTTDGEQQQTGDCVKVNKPITIRAAADYDQLSAGCWDLYGKLRIEGAAITSMHKLGKLTAVNDLEIVDTGLTTLDLEAPFEVWGSITISGNSKLTSIDKLRLQDADDLTTAYTIRNNAALTSLAGLGYAKSVEGELRISDNPKLSSIAFDELTTAGSVTISNNGATSLDLGSLQQVNRLEISNNPQLTTVTGIAGATVRGDLVLRGNRALAQVGSWGALSRVEGGLTIDDNDALTSLAGLSGLTYVTGAVAITNNGAITALNTVSHLQGIGLTVNVTGNTSLDGCLAWEIYYCVRNTGVSISNNKPNTGANQGSNCPRFWCE